jgi:hypothetical protein
VGGPGNSLDRNYINFIAKRTANTNVGFVNLLQRHHKPWMNGRVRSMNLQLDMSDIGVTDASSIARENFTTYGLHLNSQGKKRLTHLIAEMVIGGCV